MKRIIALLLTAVMLMAIVGCGESEQAATTPETTVDITGYVSEGLSMGYAIRDITPEESTPLAGYGATTKRWSNEIGYEMKATAMALTGSNGKTILVMTFDLITTRDWAENLILRLTSATGLSEDQIFLSASHTHCSPDLGLTGHIDALDRYLAKVLNASTEAALAALADRKPTQVSFGDAETSGLNFVRHYYNTASDGSVIYFGDNYGHEYSPDDTTKHMTQADPTIHVVKFSREGEKDMLLCNFRAHPAFHGASSKNIASSDYIGAFRENIELALDCDFMYMQGACGNINHSTRAAGETAVSDVGEYAMKLTQGVMEALENMTPVEGADLETATTTVEFQVNHELDHLFFEAKNIASVWSINRDINEVIPMCRAYGMSSPFHANAIVSRYNRGESETVQLSAYRLGDNLTFGVWPFEVFDTLAVYVEENAPYEKVITMGYSYPHVSYLPTDATWEYTSYETDTFPYVRGTGEIVRDTILDLMEQIKPAE